MKLEYLIREFGNNAKIFTSLFSIRDQAIIHWRPSPEKWNLLEILCHLVDEEKEDFRLRLKLVLEDPSRVPPSIDPVGWVKSREYDQQNFSEKMKEFESERASSIEWLNDLKNPAWDNTYMHPQLGPMSGKLYLNNWLAHDYLHIRQILATKHSYLRWMSDESLSYAGDW